MIPRLLARLLLVFGFAIALLHLNESKWAAEDAQHILAENLTTRYIGEFPSSPFLHELVDTLQHANRRLLIACDSPGYGRRADPNQYWEYRTTLDKKSSTLSIQMVVLDRSRRDELLTTYFPDKDGLEKIPRYWIEDLAERYGPITTVEGFRDAVNADQEAEWTIFSRWKEKPLRRAVGRALGAVTLEARLGCPGLLRRHCGDRIPAAADVRLRGGR